MERPTLLDIVADLKAKLETPGALDVRCIESQALEHACRFLASVAELTSVAIEFAGRKDFKRSDECINAAAEYVQRVSRYNGSEPVFPGHGSVSNKHQTPNTKSK